MTIKEAREILNLREEELSDEEVQELIDTATLFKDIFFSFPSKRYLRFQSFPPVGVTRRKRPPPSKSFWGFSFGLTVLTLVSVRGAIRFGMGVPPFLGASIFPWGLFAF